MQTDSKQTEGAVDVGSNRLLGDGQPFPENAQRILTAFYEALGVTDEQEKIRGLRRGFELEDAVITHDNELKGLEFYVLTKLKII